MARLPRVTSKLFAENATEVGQFGAFNTGTKLTTTDIATIQGLPAWQNGWQAATVGGNCYPTLQERNGLDKVQSYFLNYLYQEGIPEWDSGTTYYTGSIVKLINGTNVQLYQSLVDNNTAVLSDTTAWQAYDYADRTLSNITSISNNAQTLLDDIYANKNIAVTHNQNTSVGTWCRPVYVDDSGVVKPCSGLSVNYLCCTIRATTSSTANITNPAVIKQNYFNGSSWYRIWSDEWIEQGGWNSNSISNQWIQQTLLKNFSNTNYMLIVSGCVASNMSSSGTIATRGSDKTVSSFYVGTSYTYNNGYYWYACGY